MMSDLFFVIDCESIGLHGETFAVAYVVVERSGNIQDEGLFVCPIDRATGDEEGRTWVAENVKIDLSEAIECHDPRDVRFEFWADWCAWKEKGAVLAADVAWPVEARFLVACVDDQPEIRRWEGPYPLIDIASVRLAAGLDPLATVERFPDELPAHDPLADARQSARLLTQALRSLENSRRFIQRLSDEGILT